MEYTEFIGKVRSRAGLATDEEAEKATRASLEVLSQELSEGETFDLAALLPSEITYYLRLGGKAEALGLSEFLERIGNYEGVSTEAATEHAKAVFSVLADAVPSGEIADVRSQLPKEILALFGAKEDETWH